MNHSNSLFHFQRVMAIWQKELKKYSIEQLLMKPEEDSWSLGQVYNHLIGGTINFHLKQVEVCLLSKKNIHHRKNLRGYLVFHIFKNFPPIKIKVPASEVYTPKQPESMERLSRGLQQVLKEYENLYLQVSSGHSGKTLHPGFGYLNAGEWYRLIPMHFNHHLRQKQRLDQYLNSKNE